jgi:hypothetical protein
MVLLLVVLGFCAPVVLVFVYSARLNRRRRSRNAAKSDSDPVNDPDNDPS